MGACQSETPKKDGMTASTPAATATFANTIDPICEMEAKPTWTDTAHYDNKVYGFCSDHCKTTFKADPAKYMAMMK